MILFLIDRDFPDAFREARNIFRQRCGKFPTHLGIREEDKSDELMGVDIVLVTMSPPRAPPPKHFYLWGEYG